MTEPPGKAGSVSVRDDDDPRAMMRAARIADLDMLHRRMQATGNPLYAWDAIRHCHHPNYPLPYPRWVCDYLDRTATELHVLGRLLDPTLFPERRAAESDAEFRLRFEDWAAGKHGVAITPREARELTAGALGLVRRGWNAFKQFHADARARSDALDHDLRSGQSAQAALDGKLAQSGRTDADSLRRRIAYGRKLLERPARRMTRAKPNP